MNDEEQELRFQQRMRNPVKRWKLSKMDIESRRHWVGYSKAKDHMFAATDTKVPTARSGPGSIALPIFCHVVRPRMSLTPFANSEGRRSAESRSQTEPASRRLECGFQPDRRFQERSRGAKVDQNRIDCVDRKV